MNPWIFWLEVGIVFVLLYFVLLLIDSIVTATTGESKLWFKRDLRDEFPYPEACWICKRGDCVGCEVLHG